MRKNFDKIVAMAKTPITEQPPIKRRHVGPFVMGYVEAAMIDTKSDDWFGDGLALSNDYNLFDLTERTMAQMIRDCCSFYWQNRDVLEKLIVVDGVKQSEIGACFWRSRNTLPGGFADQDWNTGWVDLNQSAIGCGPFRIWDTGQGQVDGITGEMVYNRETGQCDLFFYRGTYEPGETL